MLGALEDHLPIPIRSVSSSMSKLFCHSHLQTMISTTKHVKRLLDMNTKRVTSTTKGENFAINR
ncbi:hypothetical protein HYC85_027730 [Camellia sinensis]|uniref:Uncharacterized protein n=1 Tax=Camellia sinensis TaxID=4442 RepID=A0A7J7FTE1_CAMSI|nr:hypothetical protein HYC85_027730 [Camellia sinensis]